MILITECDVQTIFNENVQAIRNVEFSSIITLVLLFLIVNLTYMNNARSYPISTIYINFENQKHLKNMKGNC